MECQSKESVRKIIAGIDSHTVHGKTLRARRLLETVPGHGELWHARAGVSACRVASCVTCLYRFPICFTIVLSCLVILVCCICMLNCRVPFVFPSVIRPAPFSPRGKSVVSENHTAPFQCTCPDIFSIAHRISFHAPCWLWMFSCHSRTSCMQPQLDESSDGEKSLQVFAKTLKYLARLLVEWACLGFLPVK